MAEDKKKQEPIVESEWVEPTVETEWVEPTSPKSTAPSQLGGKSGAQTPPLASTSTSSESSLGSWTTEANPLKNSKPKYEPSNFGEILQKAKIGVINPDLDEVANKSKPMNVGGVEVSVKGGEAPPMALNVPKKEVDQDIDLLTKRTNVVRKMREQEIDKAKQFKLGLEQLQQKGAALNEQYKANPTPELEAELNQTVKDLQDTEKAYNRAAFAQDVYEKRILQTSDSIKKLANDKVSDNFYKGVYQGMKGNVDSWEESYNLANLGKAEQIQYAKDQATKAPTEEASGGGGIGEMIGGVIPDIAAAVGFSLAGAPIAGAATVAARQGAQQGAQDFSRVFNEVKAKGLPSGEKDADGNDIMREATDDEAYDIATRAAGFGVVTGAVEGLVGVAGGGKVISAIANKAKTQGGKIIAGKVLDTASDAAVAGTMQASRNAFDQYQGLDTELGSGVLENMAGEVLLSAPINTVSGVNEYSAAKKKEAVKEVFKAVEESKSNPYELQKLQSNLDVLKNQGMISDIDYNELNKKAEDYIKVVETIPTEVKDKQKAADLILERDELEAKKESVDKAFQKPIDEKINDINEELVVLATPEAKAGDNITPIEDGKENDQEGRQENVLTPTTETAGVVEATPIVEHSEDYTMREVIDAMQGIEEGVDSDYGYKRNAKQYISNAIKKLTGIEGGGQQSKYFSTGKKINGKDVVIRVSDHEGYSDEEYKDSKHNKSSESAEKMAKAKPTKHIISIVVNESGSKRLETDYKNEDNMTVIHLDGIDGERTLSSATDYLADELNSVFSNTKKASSDVNIQQPMGEEKTDVGAVGDVAKEELPKEEVEERFTEAKDLNRIYANLKTKYGDKKGIAIYQAANRLVNPNTNTIIEVRGNGVVVKESGDYLFKPFTNTDANSKKWTLGKPLNINEQFAPNEANNPTPPSINGQVPQPSIEVNKDDNKVEVKPKVKSFQEAKDNYDAAEKKHQKHFKKDGGLRANTPESVKTELKDAYLELQNFVKDERQRLVEADNRDTGLTDGLERIKSNPSAVALVQMAIQRGLIPERQYNEFGKNLLHIIASETDKSEITVQTAEIIQDFSKRANVKVDDAAQRELQAAENAKFETVEEENNTSEIIEDEPKIEGEQVKPKTAKEIAKENAINEPKNAIDVAKIFRSLFNFSPKESVWAARLFDAKATFMAKIKGISKEDYYKEYWFDNKQQADQKGNWSKEAAKMKRLISMYSKADSTTVVHEILGHDFLDRLIESNQEEDLKTIAEEYIKATKSKEKVADILKALKEFNVETNKTTKGTLIHEWFARTAEGYFVGETQVKEGSKLAKLFDAFRAHLVELYNNMTNKSYLLPSNEMKKVFRKVFGEGNFDILNEIAQDEIIQTKKDIARAVPKEVTKELASKFEALRKQAKGLGQTEEVSFDELLAAAQWLSTQEGVNVLSVLPELKAMFPANEQMINENTRDFQQFFTPREKKVSQTAQSAFASPIVSEEGKQFVGDRLALYTPEKLKEVLSDVRKAFEDYSIENMMDAWLSGSLPYKELPVFLTELQFRVNRAIKATENGTKEEKEYRKRLISYEQKILDKIIEEGKTTAQRLNYFKIFKGMSTAGKIMHLKRNFNKANEKTKALLDIAVKSLKEKLAKAYEDNDYFLGQISTAEEKIGSLTQEVSDLNKQIEARAKRKDRETVGSPKKPENFKNKISVSDALAKYKKAKGLGQDLSSLTEQQTLAYALMQEKPKTIEQFVKEWNKVTGEKRDITELEETYKAVRQFATEVDGFEKDWFDTDSMIDESIEDYTNFKNDVELKKAQKDLELEIAKAEVAAFKKQMSDKDKEVKAREALKKREKQIVNDFLNSLGQDGLWQKYVQSNAGKIIGNLASKIGGKPSEKALLDKFITLATNEINNAINELTPNQKAQKTTPNYAQQLGDLISNQDKVAEVFDKAVKEFAEQNANDVNAQALLSKLSGLKNPFSDGLLGKSLETEAKKLSQKIGDYAFKYAGVKSIARRQFVGEILKDSELQGAEFDQLKQDLYDKFNAIISETEIDVAGQLATALIADSKKTLGLMPKQSDYVKELLGYLKNKAKDYYKSETNKTLVDPIDQLKYAVEMLNDRNGKKIWDDSKAEVIKKIDNDQTLSQTEKDNLKQHLDNYQNTVLDQLLSSNKLFNNIKQVIINETPFVKNGAVDWNAMITQAKGNVAVVKDIIRQSIEGKVQGYNTQQVDAVLDAIGREFDARINEKKAVIIEKQLKDIQGGKIIRQKKIAKGKVQKLIEMENSGALNDTRFEQELGKYLGMKEMTPQKWARLRELIIDAEEAPEGNERDRAIEKMAAYVKLNSVGKTAEIYTSLYYAGMLARPTTIIKNATGISEPIIRLMYKALTDVKYAKMMIQGLKRGDAKDVWGGGLVQGSKLDEEVGVDGMPRVNILKQWSEQTNNKFVKFVAGGSKILDLLTMADAISQAMVGSGAEYGNYVNYLLEENKEAIKLDPTIPVLTKKQAREQAFSELTNTLTFDGAMMQAKSEFATRGIIPSEARLKRRAYEITREMILPTQVRELAQNTALEEAYKSKLPSVFVTSGEKKQERRLTENAGVFTSLGGLANEIVQAISNYAGGKISSVASIIPMSEARAKKLDENLRQVLAQRVLPFARGMSNVMEQALEKTPYGIIKGGISLGLEYKNYRKPTSLQEAVEHKYMMDRAKDKIAKSAASMILGGIFYSTVMAISRAGDDDEPERLKTGFYSAGEVVKYGKNNIEKFTFPTNCMVIGGRVIPLSLLGTQGIGAVMLANMYDNFVKKAEKQAGKVKDPESIESMQGYAMFMQSMGNITLSMSAFSSLSDLQEAVSPTSNSKVSDYMSQIAVKSAVLPIPYVGTFGQVAQGARYLFGDKSAQTAIGLDERAWKEFGLQGIAYDRPVYNYRGKIVSAPQRNTEGVAGLAGIADKWKLDPIDNYLYKELNYNPTLDKRLSDRFQNKEKAGMTKEEYYDYGKEVGQEFNLALERNYARLRTFEYTPVQIEKIKKDEYITQEKVLENLVEKKKDFVSDLQNAIEDKYTLIYQLKKGVITNEKYEKDKVKINERIETLEKYLGSIIKKPK